MFSLVKIKYINIEKLERYSSVIVMERISLKKAKKIVIKVGTSSLTYPDTGRISIKKLDNLVRQIVDLKNSGKEVILVSSAAQAVGLASLNLESKPSEIAKKQAVAAVGQANLMMIYQKLFKEYGVNSGQVLMTRDIVDNDKRRNNAINTFKALLEYDVVPIVNENDTVSTDEIEFGDNDTLSSVVAQVTSSDLLIILSDIDGLYTDDPNINPDAELISKVDIVEDSILAMARGSNNPLGTGGMTTKLMAAKLSNSEGISMVLANSNIDDVLYKIIEGEDIGTLFVG